MPPRLSADQSALIVVDLQPRLLAGIANQAAILRNTEFLLDVARVLNVEVRATEQNPEKLGATAASIRERLNEPPIPKLPFTACLKPEFTVKSSVLLLGIETHVCVMQSALDWLALGRQVFLAVDAVGARGVLDHDLALRRLERAGAVLTTVETAAFEWLRGAEHPQFRAVSALVKARMG